MKKTLYILMAVGILMSGCKKKSTDDTTPATNTTPAPVVIGNVPTTFTQKVLIEDFSATWCGYCPDATTTADQIMTAHAGKAVAISMHISDVMSVADGEALDSYFNQWGYPAGMINRMLNNTASDMAINSWGSKANNALAQTPTCGLAIDAASVSGSTVSVTVHAGFKIPLSGDYRLVVALIESPITGGSEYDQKNYEGKACSDPSSSSAWYNSPCVISGFAHKNVLRKFATDKWGDAIPATDMAAGKQFVKTYSFNMTGFNSTNCSIVAYVNNYNYGSSPTAQKIQNVQVVKVGAVKSWD